MRMDKILDLTCDRKGISIYFHRSDLQLFLKKSSWTSHSFGILSKLKICHKKVPAHQSATIFSKYLH